jgi:hypothetical protein
MFKSKLVSLWGAAVSFALITLFSPLAAAVNLPHIDNLGVEQVTALDAGTELQFTLQGTPMARASLRITGVPRTILLKETDRGYYEGTYTIRKQDRIPSNAAVVATLSQGKRRAVGRLNQRLLLASAQPVQASAPTQPASPVQPAVAAATPVSIDRFTADQIERYEPGTDLKFTLNGTPHARASFTIAGVVANRAMDEVRTGVYEGSYTIRRQDKFSSSSQVTGTLQGNGQTARAQLDQRLVNDNEPPSVSNVSPKDNETVPASATLTVSGNLDDEHGTGVDPKSVKIIFDGKDVTSQSAITAQNFSYRPTSLAIGNHTVDVRARDQAGNASRTSWNFRTATNEAAPAAIFPLDILSPRDNAEVGPGPIEVRGRTLPNASVDIDVTAGLFGLTQRIFENTLRADPQGYFSFSFRPPVKVRGARYDVNVRATKDKETRERSISLTQQR